MDELLKLDRELRASSRRRPTYTQFAQERSLDASLDMHAAAANEVTSSGESSVSPRSPRRFLDKKRSIGNMFAENKEAQEQQLARLTNHRMSADNSRHTVADSARRVAMQQKKLLEEQEAIEQELSNRVCVRRGFAHFIEYIKYEIRLHVGATQMIMILAKRGIRAFQRGCNVNSQQQQMRLRALNALQSLSQRKGLNTWMEATMQAHAARVLLRRALLSLHHFSLRRAVNTWTAYAAEVSAKRRRLRAAGIEIVEGRRRGAWLTWREYVDERRLLRRGAASLTTPGLRRAFAAWGDFASGHADRVSALTRGLQALRSVGLRRGLNSWQEACAEALEARRRLQVAMREWAGGKVIAAFSTWVSRTEEQMMILRAAQSFRKPGLSKAVRAWAMAARGTASDRARLGGALASLRHHGARKALNSWRSVVAQVLRLRGLLRSLGSVPLRKAYNTWVAQWAHGTHMAILGLRAVTAIAFAELRRGLNTWVDAAFDHKSANRKARLLYQSAARHLLTRTIGGCFQLWRSSCERRSRMLGRKSMQRCFAVLTARDAMRSAMRAWAREADLGRRQEMSIVYRDVERDLAAARKRVSALEGEVAELRKSLIERADEIAWKSSFEAENGKLRKQLDEERKAIKGLEGRNGELEEQYRRLWRATHDPNYVAPVQPDEQLVWKVPASRNVVDRLAHVADSSVGAVARPKSPRTVSPRRGAGEAGGPPPPPPPRAATPHPRGRRRRRRRPGGGGRAAAAAARPTRSRRAATFSRPPSGGARRWGPRSGGARRRRNSAARRPAARCCPPPTLPRSRRGRCAPPRACTRARPGAATGATPSRRLACAPRATFMARTRRRRARRRRVKPRAGACRAQRCARREAPRPPAAASPPPRDASRRAAGATASPTSAAFNRQAGRASGGRRHEKVVRRHSTFCALCMGGASRWDEVVWGVEGGVPPLLCIVGPSGGWGVAGCGDRVYVLFAGSSCLCGRVTGWRSR